MGSEDVGLRRLRSQRIAGERCETPEEVVRWMGALQAQEYRQALWAIGLRTRTPALAAVERTIAERSIVLTWPLRGTLHFVPAEDVGWMLGLSAARRLAADARRLRQLELDQGIIERCKGLFHDALRGGKRLTRPAMMALLKEAGFDPAGQRGYHILWCVAQAGLICLGPQEGNQQTFVLLDEWVPESRRLTREEAAAELALRYFASHGPATLRDFAGWAGLAMADAASGLDAAKPKLVSEKIGARVYWLGLAAACPTAPDASSVHLLPGFDEFVLGYRDRGDVLAPEHAAGIIKGGVISPVIVVAGRIAGTWTRRLRRGALDIAIHPFADLQATEASVAAAARRYGEFAGLPVASIADGDAR